MVQTAHGLVEGHSHPVKHRSNLFLRHPDSLGQTCTIIVLLFLECGIMGDFNFLFVSV